MPPEPTNSPNAAPAELEFHYMRSGGFRTVFADGVFGGPSPKGMMRISFFTERQMTPTKTVHTMTISNDRLTIGPEVSREAKNGVERELEVEVVMNLDLAAGLRDWLDEKLNLIKAATADQTTKTS